MTPFLGWFVDGALQSCQNAGKVQRSAALKEPETDLVEGIGRRARLELKLAERG